MPTRWINVQRTYETFRTKLKDQAATKVDKLEAIDYWIARLTQDATTIALDEDFVDNSP